MRQAVELVGIALMVTAFVTLGWHMHELIGLIALFIAGSFLVAVANAEERS